MALALILLIGAGLMIRSINALWDVDPGFRSDNVLTFNLNLPPSTQSADPAAVRNTLRELGGAINSVPGVHSSSFSDGAFPILGEDDLLFWLADRPKPASQSEMNMTIVSWVEPGYLAVMGMSLQRGRFFSEQDDERAQPVAVIDEVFARKYFPNEDAVGRRIQFDDDRGPRQIIGVVGHVKQWGLEADDRQSLRAQLYLPFRALTDEALSGGSTAVRVVAHTEKTMPSLLNSIRHAVRSKSSQSVISGPLTMDEIIANSLAGRRSSMMLLNVFAAVALLLASVGLYGVISYLVGQRTQEFGIRLALGARPVDLFRLVLGQGLKMALGGVTLGLVAAFLLTRLMEKMLFGVSATDPATFTVIALLLTVVALLASLVPARRATKVDPMLALRSE